MINIIRVLLSVHDESCWKTNILYFQCRKKAFSNHVTKMKKYSNLICTSPEMIESFQQDYEKATGDTLSVSTEYLKEASSVIHFCIDDEIVAGFVINGNTENLRYLSNGVLGEEDKLRVLENNDIQLSSVCEITCLYSKRKLKGIERVIYYASLLYYLWKMMNKEKKSILLGGSYIKGIRKAQKQVLSTTLWTYFINNRKGKRVFVEIYCGIVNPKFYTKVGLILVANLFTVFFKKNNFT